MQINHVPALEHFSGSWVITRIKDDSMIGEFYEKSNVEKFNLEVYRIETAYQYLTRINKEICSITP